MYLCHLIETVLNLFRVVPHFVSFLGCLTLNLYIYEMGTIVISPKGWEDHMGKVLGEHFTQNLQMVMIQYVLLITNERIDF